MIKTITFTFFLLLSLWLSACSTTVTKSTEGDKSVDFDILWRSYVGFGNNYAYNNAKPVVKNGNIYSGSVGGIFYAFEQKNGNRLWKTQLALGELLGQSLLHENILYIPSVQGYLWLLNANNGKLLNKFNIPATLSTPIIHEDNIILHSTNDVIVAINISSGKEVWRYVYPKSNKITTFVHSSLVSFQDFIVAGMSDGKLIALDANKGRRYAWEQSLGNNDSEHIIKNIVDVTGIKLQDGHIYATAYKGGTVKVNLQSMRNMWIAKSASSSMPLLVDTQSTIAIVADTGLQLLNKQSGKLLWQTKLNNLNTVTNVVAYGDYLITGSHKGELCILQRNNGDLLYCSYISVNKLNPILTISNNNVFASDTKGFLFAIKIKQLIKN